MAPCFLKCFSLPINVWSVNNSWVHRSGLYRTLFGVEAERNLACRAEETMVPSSSSATTSTAISATPPETVASAIELLELVRSSTKASPLALALFCDELSRIVIRGELDPRVEVTCTSFFFFFVLSAIFYLWNLQGQQRFHCTSHFIVSVTWKIEHAKPNLYSHAASHVHDIRAVLGNRMTLTRRLLSWEQGKW